MTSLKDMASRRDFLVSSGSALGWAWLGPLWPDMAVAAAHAQHAIQSDKRPAFEFFTPEQATEVEAIAAQIIPSDDTPGATEAGVVYFIDRALATFFARYRPAVEGGVQEIQARVRDLFPGNETFVSLTSEQQFVVMEAIEATDFFFAFHFLTLAGMFANPSYGGNRDQIGWKLIGFEDRFVFQPPFGYYDRGHHGKQ